MMALSELLSRAMPLKNASSLKNGLILLSSLSSLCMLLFLFPNRIIPPSLDIRRATSCVVVAAPDTSLSHIVFGIASSASSWHRRASLIRAWYDPRTIRAYAFLDRAPSGAGTHSANDSGPLPPVRVSEDTSRFPYTFRGGTRSAIRNARIVSEIVAMNLSDVRWIVLGDDDTVFVPENLVRTVSKYEWERWYYVGGISESWEQNSFHSFLMAYGGGGIAISYPLARALARVMDSCLMRYPDLWGSDARVFACVAELGVALTPEQGFHQTDLRGNLYGLLVSHPPVPLVSLHHLDNYTDPIFPNMTASQAMEHLFRAARVDPARVLQQTVCYDRANSRTISVSWGYAVQVFESILRLPDLLSLQKTFVPFKSTNGHFMFKTTAIPMFACKKPAVFFLDNVSSDGDGTRTHYKRQAGDRCLLRKPPTKFLKHARVFSQKLVPAIAELKAPRRDCCDVLPSSTNRLLEIEVRKCRDNELIAMDVEDGLTEESMA